MGLSMDTKNEWEKIAQGILDVLTKESQGNMPTPDLADQSLGMAAIPAPADVGGTISGDTFGVPSNLDAFNMPSSM
jgi:hypothetical protein